MFVHCRTGSLENKVYRHGRTRHVYCRTGSLEMMALRVCNHQQVHCRIGSLVIVYCYEHIQSIFLSSINWFDWRYSCVPYL
ncbi:Putative uncharacterized protein [Moritella viscosa]|uniref:Uncharacterized protein n=1 Tax=Moritella viscosa TaxID=80854 RepID=A0A1K9ZD47_9GAMM|nr:Putative uncharacterized protein [Moritella viscosa]SHO04598.1 Putative uncharacterized protein [Moritella viscosa]